MKIKTKLQVTTAVSLIVALVIGLILFFSVRQVNESIKKDMATDEIIKGLFELNILTNYYLLHHEERAKTQWQLKHDSIKRFLEGIEVKSPEKIVLLKRMREGHKDIKNIFSQMVENYEGHGDEKEGISQELNEMLVGNLETKSRSMVSDAYQLAEISSTRLIASQQKTYLLVLLSSLTIVVVVATVSFSIYSGVVKPIGKLHEGTEIIGAGNLDYKVGTMAKDEVGQLSRAFDQMTIQLKESFTRLEKEITERKLAEEALRESEKKYRELVDNALVGIYMTGLNGEIIFANKALAKMYEFESPEEMMSSSILSRYKNNENRKVLIETLKKEGEVNNYELEHLTKSGKTINILLSATFEANVLSGMVMDITKRNQAEEEIRRLNAELEQRVVGRTAQLEAANKELEAFSYSVSHDLRAPLRSIDGFSQALQEDYGEKVEGQGKDYIRRIRAATKRMADLIDALLTLSRVTRSEIRLENFDLSRLARTIAADLQKIQPDRQAEFIIPEGLTANGDARLLRIVIENLIGNAWKFTSKKENACIELGSLQQGDGKLAYFVKDNGAGFDMAYADKLFGAFQRLHGAEEFSGTGIGLATVQRIIHRHGGRVWAEGKPEKGATFYFTFD
jgi:PAS domain S-box-containing protein